MQLTLPKPVETALSRLEKAGYSAYVVGGCVRDHVLGFTPHDYDICSAATPEELQKVENLVNEKIEQGLPVTCKNETIEEARAEGAFAQFDAKYSQLVSVYFIGDYSKEVCAGPHVENTKTLGHFKIVKESSSSAGVRRIRAILE